MCSLLDAALQLASVAQHLTDSKDLRAAGDYNLDTWGWAGGLASLQHAAAGLRLPWAFHSASQSKQQEETGSGQDAKPSSLKEVRDHFLRRLQTPSKSRARKVCAHGYFAGFAKVQNVSVGTTGEIMHDSAWR